MIKDYYELLQVHPKASVDIIKKAYQTLAKKYHPDLSNLPPEEASRHMSELSEAYRILSDPAKRRQYDEARQQEQYNKVRELSREHHGEQGERIPPRSARRHSDREKASGEGHTFGSKTLRYVLVGVIVVLVGVMAGLLWEGEDDGEVHYKSLKGNPTVEDRSRESTKPAPEPAREPSYDSHEEKLHPGNPKTKDPVMLDGKQLVPDGGTEQSPKTQDEEKKQLENQEPGGGKPADAGEQV